MSNSRARIRSLTYVHGEGTGAASPEIAESITSSTSRIDEVIELNVLVCGRKLEARDGC